MSAMNSLDSGKRRVAFAVCRTEPEHDPDVDKSGNGRFWLFSRLSQAQGFLAHRRPISGWEIVPVLLTVPQLPTGSEFATLRPFPARRRR